MGSGQPASAAPPIPRPLTSPITVPLFKKVAFTNFDDHAFTFTPPERKGPWAKVLFVADFNCTAGRQYDRTVQVYLGNTNIYFGTTEEPSAKTSPSWHVERDLTDYAALFKTAQTGTVNLGNIVNSTYTGILTGSAYLLFFPAGKGASPAHAANLVLALNSKPGATHLPDSKTPLAATFTFPANVVAVYLDVILQGQIGDEFWYFGVPNALAAKLQTSGGTSFREGEITIDGTSAGVAPIYPWIFSGGIDPYWWRPILGIQTYNFAPYRVDLTPFSAILDDGHPHTVAVRVYNDANYFNATGTLLVFTDPRKAKVTGRVTLNTLGSPSMKLASSVVSSKDGDTKGPVDVTVKRRFTIAGYVLTSKGRIDTRIDENIAFWNNQRFDISPIGQDESLAQDEAFSVSTTTRQPGSTRKQIRRYDWPLAIHSVFPTRRQPGAKQEASADQAYRMSEKDFVNGVLRFTSRLSDEVAPSDTILFPEPGGKRTPNSQSTQIYTYSDSTGTRWDRKVTAKNLVVTSVTDGKNLLPRRRGSGDFGVPVN